MAAIAGDLSNSILGQSDAAKAFRPWWESMKDGLMYAMVVMGMITLPMTFLSGRTPLDCTIHPGLWQISSNQTYEFEEFEFTGSISSQDMPRYARFLRSYAKKYCTEMHVSPFLLYFPFSLFLVPLTMVFTEKLFIRAYNSDVKMEQLWDMLLKSSLEREDVANLEQENLKNNHEIQQAFRNSCSVHDSFLFRTLLELVTGIGLAAFFCIFNSIDGIASALFDCNVHQIPFKCIIANSRFFWVMYTLALVLIFLYVSCCAYNLVWLLHPRVGRLERVLSGMIRKKTAAVDALDVADASMFKGRALRQAARKATGADITVHTRDAPEVRLEMYYDKKGKDFRLLMCLLSETSGLAHTFRILTVFDKHFQRQWRARDIKVIVDDDRDGHWKRRNNNAFQDREAEGEFYEVIDRSRRDTESDSEEGPIKRGTTSRKSSRRRRVRIDDGGHAADHQSATDPTCDSSCNKKDRFRSLWVFWNDASIAPYITRTCRKSLFEYTVDISPSTEAPVKSFLYHGVPDFTTLASAADEEFTLLEEEKKDYFGSPNSSFNSHSSFATFNSSSRSNSGRKFSRIGSITSGHNQAEKSTLIRNNSLSFYGNQNGGPHGKSFNRQQSSIRRPGQAYPGTIPPRSPTEGSLPPPPSSPPVGLHHFATSPASLSSMSYLSSQSLNASPSAGGPAAPDTTYKYSTRFDGLEHGAEYTVSLSTEIDGKTITQVNIVAIRGAKEKKDTRDPRGEGAGGGDMGKKKEK